MGGRFLYVVEFLKLTETETGAHGLYLGVSFYIFLSERHCEIIQMNKTSLHIAVILYYVNLIQASIPCKHLKHLIKVFLYNHLEHSQDKWNVTIFVLFYVMDLAFHF